MIKYAGAAYLMFLGVRALLAAGDSHSSEPGAGSVSMATAYRQGLVVQLLNPKVAIFFLALMPQFVDPASGPVAVQILMLGGLMALLGLVVDSPYALGRAPWAPGFGLARAPRAGRATSPAASISPSAPQRRSMASAARGADAVWTTNPSCASACVNRACSSHSTRGIDRR